MNLSTIPVTPHALGFIKVACDDDPLFGEARTRNEFVITQRHHASPETPPKLAPHPLQAKLASGEDGGAKTVTTTATTADAATPDRNAEDPPATPTKEAASPANAAKKLNYPFTLLEIRENDEIPAAPTPQPSA